MIVGQPKGGAMTVLHSVLLQLKKRALQGAVPDTYMPMKIPLELEKDINSVEWYPVAF